MRVALVVDDGGWRNTTAFELGIKVMGGLCVRAPISLAGNEAVGDLAQYLDNWFDIVVIRTPDLGQLRRLAEAATLPVINARTRSNHPCETLGDLAYVLQQRGNLSGLRVGVVAPDGNILGSWAEAAAALSIEVVQIYPERWHARRFAKIERFSATTEMGALASADAVITDGWPEMSSQRKCSTTRLQLRLSRTLRAGRALHPLPACNPGPRGHRRCNGVAELSRYRGKGLLAARSERAAGGGSPNDPVSRTPVFSSHCPPHRIAVKIHPCPTSKAVLYDWLIETLAAALRRGFGFEPEVLEGRRPDAVPAFCFLVNRQHEASPT